MRGWGDIIKKWALSCFLEHIISNFVVECFISLNKQAKGLRHVSPGLPNSSLICGNMYSGQRYQVFPRDPVSLQPFLVQTCKLAQSTTERTKQIACTEENECAFMCAPTFSLHMRLTKYYSFNGTLTNLENKGGPWQCSCYPSPLQSCINNS